MRNPLTTVAFSTLLSACTVDVKTAEGISPDSVQAISSHEAIYHASCARALEKTEDCTPRVYENTEPALARQMASTQACEDRNDSIVSARKGLQNHQRAAEVLAEKAGCEQFFHWTCTGTPEKAYANTDSSVLRQWGLECISPTS